MLLNNSRLFTRLVPRCRGLEWSPGYHCSQQTSSSDNLLRLFTSTVKFIVVSQNFRPAADVSFFFIHFDGNEWLWRPWRFNMKPACRLSQPGVKQLLLQRAGGGWGGGARPHIYLAFAAPIHPRLDSGSGDRMGAWPTEEHRGMKEKHLLSADVSSFIFRKFLLFLPSNVVACELLVC